MKWHEYPMAALDLETTGTDVFSDRIVTASLLWINAHDVDTRSWVLDPGIEIPDSTAKVHGYTTERARAEGGDYATGYGEIRDDLETAWELGYAVVAFNAAFDLSMINSEGLRLGYPELVPGLIVDPFVLDAHLSRRTGARNLTATCEHYRVVLPGAHTAHGDAIAAARLAWRLGQDGRLSLTAEQIMERQSAWYQTRQEQRRAHVQGMGRDPSDIPTQWPIRHRMEVAS